MRSFLQLSLVLSILLLPYSPVQAKHSGRQESPRARLRHTGKLNDALGAKYKRDANVAFTYFVDGRGACGGPINGPNDFIVALNTLEYGDGEHCFQMINITANGISAEAQITDECPGCSDGGLDLSQGLFKRFAPLDQGEIYGTWFYIGDVATSSSIPAPSTTNYTPSSTPADTTVAATSSTSLSTAITSSPPSTPISTTSTVPTYTPGDPQILAQINHALLEVGVLLQASFKLGEH